MTTIEAIAERAFATEDNCEDLVNCIAYALFIAEKNGIGGSEAVDLAGSYGEFPKTGEDFAKLDSCFAKAIEHAAEECGKHGMEFDDIWS